MDFVVCLPKTLGKLDSIWVIVDRLTKSAHFIPIKVTYDVEKLAKLYIREIIQLYGVPISIISDREPVAILDRKVCKLRSREIASVKVQWKNRPVEESTWETEVDMRRRYPYLFIELGTLFNPRSSFDHSGMNGG
ncbi:uncharacterized protein LOC129875729 [Solanum dulcamara]|uniref:uncharacterized protein LOC129875729 n=1 Tax=Solanum dulcamara TaxID=45834 RepID=UPI0024850D71|nr:uncharacterized protein LOC129875729 [Solanum dulcamara]